MAGWKWRAKPELRERVIMLNGQVRGYIPWLRDILAHGEKGREVTPQFIERVLNGRCSAPPWMMIQLILLAEDDLTLSRDAAIRLAPDWFYVPEEEDSE